MPASSSSRVAKAGTTRPQVSASGRADQLMEPHPSLAPQHPTADIFQVLGQPVAAANAEVPTQDENHTTCVRFDDTGRYLAVGTKGGMIRLYESDSSTAEYQSVTTAQAYQVQIDPLNSIEIDSKVKDICWIPRCNQSALLLTANEKSIKLYRVATKRNRIVSGQNTSGFIGVLCSDPNCARLEIPQLIPTDSVTECKPKRVYATEHEYQINSLSLSSDGQHFLSSDDLIIHLWNTLYIEDSLKLVSIKPESMDDLNETITTSTFHPSQCNLFCFSTSKGITHLCDLRCNVTCDNYAAEFDASASQPSDAVDPFYAALLNGVSNLAFNPVNSNHFITRDYLTLKLWDMAMPAEPVSVISVQEELLRTALPDLYDSDTIFDKFEVSWSPDAKYVATGMYRHEWALVNMSTETVYFQSPTAAAARKSALNGPPAVKGRGTAPKRATPSPAPAVPVMLRPAVGPQPEPYSDRDFLSKSLALQYHPKTGLIAAGNGGETLLYSVASSGGSRDRDRW
eukprot:NODE_309_length_1814_cov_243.155807_g250_i0.p1 GENE.NODE_309_length_1814_cov_243.155807_g250_i0~~NODE_309_length_1814_cov_243.155807_g250_i0.p1  ORF type:complete len:512 (-),score=101.97 NODE_309_length_1814_cov_243.155807_g250_i0:173-1708(-)